jgi:hypothetical protein
MDYSDVLRRAVGCGALVGGSPLVGGEEEECRSMAAHLFTPEATPCSAGAQQRTSDSVDAMLHPNSIAITRLVAGPRPDEALGRRLGVFAMVCRVCRLQMTQ